MRRLLVVQQYQAGNDVYVEIASAVLSENNIIYPDLVGNVTGLLAGNAEIPFNVTTGVNQADGWSYFKSAAKPASSGFPVVTLPENDEALPPTPAIPGDYEIRAQIQTLI